jgi:hypothetical protein
VLFISEVILMNMLIKNKKRAEGKGQTRVMNRKHILGGFMMMKMKLLAVVLICVAAGAVTAADVINVDIKGYGDNMPYIGNGAYDVGPNTVWTVYYGGWGVPVGSSRSEALVPSDVPLEQQWLSSVYAAQVWIGDPGQKHTYQYGSSMMDDGFAATTGQEPNISIFGDGAYQGVYDIYVYGKDAGSFRLTRYGTTASQSVTGGVTAGTFVEGGNYVVFSNVDVNNTNPQDLYLTYTNKLNALQLVKKKSPVDVNSDAGGTKISAGNWDVAGDRNTQNGESTSFGPDTFPIIDPNSTRAVGYIEPMEFMYYDINVPDAAKGRYNFCVDVNVGTGNNYMPGLSLFVDGKYIDRVTYTTGPIEGESNSVSINLTTGKHTVGWQLPPGVNYGFNLIYLKLTRTGSISMNNCGDVTLSGYNYKTDLSSDCYVDIYDLDLMADKWLKCSDPNGCF